MRLEDIEGLTLGGLLNLVEDLDLRYSCAGFKEEVERCARTVLVRPEVLTGGVMERGGSYG